MLKLKALLAGTILVSAVLRAQTDAPAQETRAAAAEAAGYRLEAGDAIEIRFFYNPELNEQVQIRPDGRISMPLLGEITVSGIMIAELTAKLQEQYKNILKQSAVTVQVRSYANRRVFVGGDVMRPGMLPLVGRQTVMGALFESGGLRPTAKRREVLLIRRGPDGKPVMYHVSLRQDGKQAPQAADLELQPFDVVLATEAGIVKANRAVDQYIRGMIPVLLTGGFTYLINGGIIR